MVTQNRHITRRKIIFTFFFVDLVFVLLIGYLSFYQLKMEFGDIIGLGPSRVFGNFKPSVDITILILYWLFIFYLFGHYSRNINQSIFAIIRSTSREVFLGNLLFFVIVFGPLKLFSYNNSWIAFVKITVQFFLIMAGARVFTFFILNRLFDRNRIKLNFVILGKSEALKKFLKEFNHSGYLKKFRLTGVMRLDDENDDEVISDYPVIRSYKELDNIASKGKIDDIVYVDIQKDFNEMRDVITFSKRHNIQLNIPGQLTDILKGQVKINEIEAPPFMIIYSKGMSFVQAVTKRLFDIVFSVTGLILMLPLFPFIIYSIKKTSSGPVFFFQERIGKNGEPFKILKFRTMYQNAENGTPALSSENDPRVTKTGRWLRRWRIDELPQLINVICGKMSLIGPRPERQYFMEKILERAPYYSLVLRVKPGITSFGMVKFGYAENVDQMVQRLQYDILYIENQSLILDLKILFYTIGTLLKGEGK